MDFTFTSSLDDDEFVKSIDRLLQEKAQAMLRRKINSLFIDSAFPQYGDSHYDTDPDKGRMAILINDRISQLLNDESIIAEIDKMIAERFPKILEQQIERAITAKAAKLAFTAQGLTKTDRIITSSRPDHPKKYSIDLKKYTNFGKMFYQGKFEGLSYGKAFYDYFELKRLGDDPQLEQIRQEGNMLDAAEMIKEIFEFL